MVVMKVKGEVNGLEYEVMKRQEVDRAKMTSLID